MTRCVDQQAEALLLTIVEQAGGDLRQAFGLLCARCTVDDVAGECFEAALARAVRDYFSAPRIALRGAGRRVLASD